MILVVILVEIFLSDYLTSSVRAGSLENVAILAGNITVLTCDLNGINGTVPLWNFQGVKETILRRVFNGYQVTAFFLDHYSVNSQYDLIIDETKLDHAGSYTCSPNINSKSIAELIVLASDPVCSSNGTATSKKGDIIQMGCSVVYRGNMAPVMEWSKGDGATVRDGVQEKTTTYQVTSTLTFEIRSNHTYNAFMCRTFFNATLLLKGHSTNVPEYNFTWISPDYNFAWISPEYNFTWIFPDLTVRFPSDAGKEVNVKQIIVLVVCIVVATCSVLTAVTVTIYVSKSCQVLKKSKCSTNPLDPLPGKEIAAYAETTFQGKKVPTYKDIIGSHHSADSRVFKKTSRSNNHLNVLPDDIAVYDEMSIPNKEVLCDSINTLPPLPMICIAVHGVSGSTKIQNDCSKRTEPSSEAVIYATVNKTAASGGIESDLNHANIESVEMSHTGSSLPIYSQIQKKAASGGIESELNQTNIGNVEMSHTGSSLPIYSQIQKKAASGGNESELNQANIESVDMTHTGSSLPIYSQIQKKGKHTDYHRNEEGKPASESPVKNGGHDLAKSSTYTGSDGTIYMDWNSVKQLTGNIDYY